jgi:hypothetical protein
LKQKQRGITLVELLVASFVLGLLGILTAALFRTGANGWKKMEAQSTMLADYEVLNSKISREVQRSIFSSASVATHPDGPTLAFLSAVDDTGEFVLHEDTFEPVWQKYLVFYFDQPARKLYLREVPLEDEAPEKDIPEPFEEYDEGSGDLNDYRTDGRLLMTDLDSCEFTLDNFMLTTEVKGSRVRYGDSQPETLHMINSVGFRN